MADDKDGKKSLFGNLLGGGGGLGGLLGGGQDQTEDQEPVAPLEYQQPFYVPSELDNYRVEEGRRKEAERYKQSLIAEQELLAKQERDRRSFFGRTGSFLSTNVGQPFQQYVSEPFQEYVGEPIREEAQALQGVTDAPLGGVAYKAFTDFAPGLAERFNFTLPEYPKELANWVMAGGANPLAGIMEQGPSGRLQMLKGLGTELGFGDQIQQAYSQIPMLSDVETLIGPSQGTDAETIRNLLEQAGFFSAISKLEDMPGMNLERIEQMTGGMQAEVLPALIDVTQSLNALEELNQSSDILSREELDAARDNIMNQLTEQLNFISANSEGLKNDIDTKIQPIMGMVERMAGELPSEVKMLLDNMESSTLAGMVSALSDVAAGALSDDDARIKSGLATVRDVAPDTIRKIDLARLEQDILAKGGSSVDVQAEIARRNKELDTLETTLNAVTELVIGDDNQRIEEAIQKLDIKPIIQGQRFEEHGEGIKQIAGEFLTGQQASTGTTQTAKGIIGDEITDFISENPLAMMGMFLGAAGGLGMLGDAVSGGKGPLAALPLLAPMLMRIGLGEDQYETGIASINQGLGKFTNPVFGPIFDAIPDSVYNIPLIGGMIKEFRDNPLTLTTSLTAALTGNDALRDASLGMTLTNLLFGQSESAAMNASNVTGKANLSTAQSSNVPQAQPNPEVTTASSTVGDVQQQADLNRALAEQVHALDIFTVTNTRLCQ